jgi:hypothetical protein
LSATFSACGNYRYRLEREIDPAGRGMVAWVMLNPSTADANVDDQTIRRVRHFSAQGFDSVSRVVVVNLYALRSTRPSGLCEATDAQGPRNTWHVRRVLDAADHVVAGWGASVPVWRRENPSRVLGLLEGRPLWCLGQTAGGDPCHPLRIAGDRPMRRWRLPR